MLSAKYARVHGMRNEKWNTREKMLQYRGILKLHARDKKLQTTNGEKLKRKVSRNLKELKSDVKEYRKIVNDVIVGDKRLLRTILQTQKDFAVVLQDAEPLEASRAIFQDYNLKRKQLDKLQYLKEKKKKELCNLRGEWTQLTYRLEHADEEVEPSEVQQQKRQQDLIARYQGALAKRHAAKSISDTYRSILAILKKDSKYFDGVLKALRGDRGDQCRIIYKTTLMGQLAAENLDDIRLMYKRMARDVWVNMKEREHSLEDARKKAEDVWEYAKSLVRIESDTNLAKKKDDSGNKIDKQLEKQIQQLEDIFNTMKESMLIRSYEELFVRLEGQMKQRERLSHLYKRHLKERQFMQNKKNHAELILHNLEHSMLSTTTRYKIDKKAMLEKLEDERKRERENKQMIESRGELLMSIRAALQNLAAMLVCVKPAKGGKGKRGGSAAKEAEKHEETEEPGEKLKKHLKEGECDDSVDPDGLILLQQVLRKATTLFGQTSFSLDPEKQEKAKDLYENYIAEYRSKLKFGVEEPEQTGMYIEHEAVDASVPTRAEIKMKSKQVVEVNTKED